MKDQSDPTPTTHREGSRTVIGTLPGSRFADHGQVRIECWRQFPSSVVPLDVPISQFEVFPATFRERITGHLVGVADVGSSGRFDITLPDTGSGCSLFYRVFSDTHLLATGRVETTSDDPSSLKTRVVEWREWPIPAVVGGGLLALVAAAGIGWWLLGGEEDADRDGFSPPPLDRTVASGVAESAAFLYTGDDPVQKGVDPDDIDPARVAVLRGRVTDRDGDPVSGVRVSVRDHPEFGYTSTRDGGTFDMVVNGGTRLTIRYEYDGHIPAQRARQVPWQEYVWYPDVAIASDAEPTDVTLDADEPQTVHGPGVTDESGSRRTTVLARPNTTFQSGSGIDPGSIQLAVTEYTVGERGPAAMPDRLPPDSGYTYAVDVTLSTGRGGDDGVEREAGVPDSAMFPRPFLGDVQSDPTDSSRMAQSEPDDDVDVKFDPPLVHYVEDFLGFPVGGRVPVGYYEDTEAAWVPADNGRILEVLDTSDGLATVDVDGSGSPADETALRSLGITEAERRQLAELYEAGTVLWRTQLPGFLSSAPDTGGEARIRNLDATVGRARAQTQSATDWRLPWDCNWPFGPPTDAIGPIERLLSPTVTYENPCIYTA